MSAPGVSNDVVVACLWYVQQQPAKVRLGHGQPSCQFVVNAAACSSEQDAGIRGSEDTFLVACNLHGDACKRDSSGMGRSAPPEGVDAAVGRRGGAQRRHCCHLSGGAGLRATHRHLETRSGGDGDAEPGASSPWGRGIGAPACGVAPGVCCAAPSRRCRGRRPARGDQGVDEQGCVHPLAEPASRAQAAGAAGCASSVFASIHAAQRRHGHGPCSRQAGRTAEPKPLASAGDERHPHRMRGGRRRAPRHHRPPTLTLRAPSREGREERRRGRREGGRAGGRRRHGGGGRHQRRGRPRSGPQARLWGGRGDGAASSAWRRGGEGMRVEETSSMEPAWPRRPPDVRRGPAFGVHPDKLTMDRHQGARGRARGSL